MQILPLTEDHWPGVREIYLEGIATRQATFELAAPSWEQWDAAHLKFCRLVITEIAEIAEGVVGWAALSSVSSRRVYDGVAEVSVYVGSTARGKGHGHALLDRLITDSEGNGIWTLQASIFPENLASLALHKACGFRVIGERERIARLDGVWRTTVLIERRSAIVGTT